MSLINSYIRSNPINDIQSQHVWCPNLTKLCHLVSRQTAYFEEKCNIQGVFKKRPNVCYKYFILQHFKHCPPQSSPLYWRYTVPNVSSIIGMLPGTHFL